MADRVLRLRGAMWLLVMLSFSDLPSRNSLVRTPSARATDSRTRVPAVIGSCGSKVKSTVIPDLSVVLRSALLKELRTSELLRVFEDSRNLSLVMSGYSIDGSVTSLSRRNTPQGDVEVSADVSLIVSALPARRVVAMVSGGATVTGSVSADPQFGSLLLQNLQQEAIQHAVQEATSSWLESLGRKQQRNQKLKLVALR